MSRNVGRRGPVPQIDNHPVLKERIRYLLSSKPRAGSPLFLYCTSIRPDFRLSIESKSHIAALAGIRGKAASKPLSLIPLASILDFSSKACKPIAAPILRNHVIATYSRCSELDTVAETAEQRVSMAQVHEPIVTDDK